MADAGPSPQEVAYANRALGVSGDPSFAHLRTALNANPDEAQWTKGSLLTLLPIAKSITSGKLSRALVAVRSGRQGPQSVRTRRRHEQDDHATEGKLMLVFCAYVISAAITAIIAWVCLSVLHSNAAFFSVVGCAAIAHLAYRWRTGRWADVVG